MRGTHYEEIRGLYPHNSRFSGTRCHVLEYGKSVLEIHKDAIHAGQKALIVDDLLATGGTAKAMAQLIEKLGGEVVSMLFMIELAGLGGRKFLEGYRVDSALIFDGK